jgi:hypothetical protein
MKLCQAASSKQRFTKSNRMEMGSMQGFTAEWSMGLTLLMLHQSRGSPVRVAEVSKVEKSAPTDMTNWQRSG